MHDHEATTEAYYAAWKARDRDGILSLVTPDLRFRSPIDDFDGAAAFLDACLEPYGGMSIQFTERLFGDTDGWIAYELPDAEGDPQHFAEHLTFRDGRIASIRVYFGAKR